MNKKILISLSVIGAVAAIAVGGTIAYFSDVETSVGNTFTAGEIDLTIDNESYYNGQRSENTSWTLSDLTGQLFFNFSDLKPGDIGEDTISLHVESNDAWLCAAVQITDDSDQSCTEPELGDDADCPANGGELADNIEFFFWADDGDNVYEIGEQEILKGPIDNVNGVIALADSRDNVWGINNGGALPANTTKYIGKAWCFGDLTMVALAENSETGPLTRPGFASCNGANVNNAPQTDRVMGDIQFYAVQARNNPNFLCSTNYTPTYTGTRTLLLENKEFDSDWDVIEDDTKAFLTYKTADVDFDFTLDYYGLTVGTSYTLIYYADKQDRFDNWGGAPLGKVITTFAPTSATGTETGNVELSMDLPATADWNGSGEANYCAAPDFYDTCRGAKIWLVPSSDLTGGALPLAAWNPSTYLFETDLINYNDTDTP